MNRSEFHLYPKDLRFSVFTSAEIKKLSVVKVVTGLTFNSLGHALPGGLYDPAMGCYGKSSDPCASCLSTISCPGHFGHIELKTLVYNPFFKALIHSILRMSCLKCYKFQCTEFEQNIRSLQLNLVDNGYIIEALELDNFKSGQHQNNAEMIKTEGGFYVHAKIAEMKELLAKGPNSDFTNTKTSISIRTTIIRSILHNLIKKCIHCHHTIKPVKMSYGKLMIGVSKSEMESFYDTHEPSEAGSIRSSNKVILADECRNYLQKIYNNSPDFFQLIFPVLKYCSNDIEFPVDIFFMSVIPVVPLQSRPADKLHGEMIEHPQTKLYKNILESNLIYNSIVINMKSNDNQSEVSAESKNIYEASKGDTPYEKLYNAWINLQSHVDELLNANKTERNKSFSLQNLLEKKEGLMRKHMMGKRVNYAARTVITPDPNIHVDELGVPDIFAKKLSYPVPVTPWNVTELRKLVMNGPNCHPGANYVEDGKGNKTLIPPENRFQRESIAKLLLTNPAHGIKTVHRHLRNGDIVLFNRQPTLHRASIMGHKVRILHGEKTFRLHYSNCKAYNADFDGDEMNAHLPQNEVGRSEAYNLVNVCNQYLVAKDGTPLGGLIQDHIISGVKLSIRGRFFNKEDYQQLVFQGLSHLGKNIRLLPPSIIKPFKLWSGKQVLSTLILNVIPDGIPSINLTSTAKISVKSWQKQLPHTWISGGTMFRGNEMTENEVIINNGELLVGVLDKMHYGATPYGLIHCMYELYGGNCSTQLLTAFSKLFTFFLQREGFTLGVKDILVTPKADKKRHSIIKTSRQIGDNIVASVLDLPDNTSLPNLSLKMDEAYAQNPKFRKVLDRKYKSIFDRITNEINMTCLPSGLLSTFPDNNLQLMVLSGAKGSSVNTMQISCLLGQIELEGKRPPLMISGKSLPSFSTFETSAKSGGFVDGRFMTGIQPQEFFFHCMAGREGLIDTAVKTSRSGYLQRCLIKHLEGLNVNYDLTVRDSDGSVVQFLYGEDGMDVAKSQFFNTKSLNFLKENSHIILHSNAIDRLKIDGQFESVHRHSKKIKSWRKNYETIKSTKHCSGFQQFSAELRKDIEVKNPKKMNKTTGRLKLDMKLVKLWTTSDANKKHSYTKKFRRCPDPIISKYKPDNVFGAISEYLDNLMKSYFKENSDKRIELTEVLYVKSMRSIAFPGEPVGLLAAQSIGEPSTQMTLNTFHFAGRGEMNVTLGIPRLREILMMASKNIKTPSLDIPFKKNQIKNAEKLRLKLNRVTISDVLDQINIKIRLLLRPERGYEYTLRFKFLPQDAYEDNFAVTPKQILKYMNEFFFNNLFRALAQSLCSKSSAIEIVDDTAKNSKQNSRDDEYIDEIDANVADNPPVAIDDSSDDDMNGDDDDATDIKLKNKKHDENDYDDPEEEELQDANDDVNSEPDMLEEADHLDEVDEDLAISAVKAKENVRNYTYDKENNLWCQITFLLPVKYKKLNISNVLREIAKKSVIREVPNIKRAITYIQKDNLILKTDGINIGEMFKYNKLLDLNRLYSNDIHAMAKTYGIEAAARVIVKEVQNVFCVYGITVDPRHLLLIADYMTFDGTFNSLSRKGMEFNSSPLKQMSFESTLRFLKEATVSGRLDDLISPSSRLMVGLPVKCGTGSFSLYTKCELT